MPLSIKSLIDLSEDLTTSKTFNLVTKGSTHLVQVEISSPLHTLIPEEKLVTCDLKEKVQPINPKSVQGKNQRRKHLKNLKKKT